jgi:Na+-translocating ferredoxin:NAD+ oxidoreductase subunit D
MHTSPYLHQDNSVARIMKHVLIALLPAIAVYAWFFGMAIIIHIVLASVFALALEALLLWLRRRPLRLFLSDGSALVTAWLLALTVPPLVPWWMTFIGIGFALIFAKHLYGGLGYNPFNPAMVGFAVLFISFPAEMTVWPRLDNPLGWSDSFNWIFNGLLPVGANAVDAISSATPLDTLKMQLARAHTLSEIRTTPLFGFFGARGWEWVALAYLGGGVWLIYHKIITWHIPVGVLGALFLIASVFFILYPDNSPSPMLHLFSGATMIGAFFIATDPVTAATSQQAKLIYAAGIGVLIYIIRTWGGYPDGVAFAVLLMNMTVPMLDYYTRPRVFGH